jgi:integrase
MGNSGGNYDNSSKEKIMAKRRGNSEGSIFRLKDGRWCAMVSLGYRNGKRWRKKYTAPTRSEVQGHVRKAVTSIAEGYTLDTNHMRMGEFLEAWLEHSAKNAVGPSTFESYSALVRRYLAPRLARVELAKLTAPHVRQCLNDLLERGGAPHKDENGEMQDTRLSPRTVQYCRAVLRKALNQALRDGLVLRNAAALTDPPKVVHPEISPYTPEQARAFLEAVKGDRLEALFTVAVAVGLRQGEILGLRWEDIDLFGGVLSVRYQLQRIDGKPRLVEPKTKRSRRTIKLPAVAVSALRTHLTKQSEERALAGESWREWGLVFASTIGTPIESCNLNHRFQRLAEFARLPKIRFHDLRHTAATLLLAQGVHPRLVMEILGHSSISLTMNTYSHVIPVMQEEVAAKMNGILTASAVGKDVAEPSKAVVFEPVATSVATEALPGIIQ